MRFIMFALMCALVYSTTEPSTTEPSTTEPNITEETTEVWEGLGADDSIAQAHAERTDPLLTVDTLEVIIEDSHDEHDTTPEDSHSEQVVHDD